MSAMDHPTMLTKLIIGAETALQMRCDVDSAQRHGDLLGQLTAEYERPAEGVRVIDTDVMIFATALGAASQKLIGHQREQAAKYLRVLGVLLPEIRAALSAAIEIRKRPSP